MAPRHCLSSSGVSWIPIQPERPYFAMRFAERFGSLSPLKKIGGCGFCTGFAWICALGSEKNLPLNSAGSFVQIAASSRGPPLALRR
jgi:hypothetical protein